MPTPLIYIVDDDDSIRLVLARALSQAGFRTETFDGKAAVSQRMKEQLPDLLLSDLNMPSQHKDDGKNAGLLLLQEFKAHHPLIPVIIMTAYSDLDNTVAAFHSGAFEYLSKPFDLNQVITTVQRALEKNLLISADECAPLSSSAGLLGRAPAMQAIFRAIGRLSQSSASVLITGESGTGKELVARALHQHSPRARKPFIAINTAAIAKELLESELFGHEKGAFTGAYVQRKGVFETAQGGTLFLDEIGDMPLALQTRLLRVLSQNEFYRVGGTELIQTDVRIIAATHQDLETLVLSHVFRIDLLHRLKVIAIHLPPLRERRDDIAELAQHFLHQHASRLGLVPKALSPKALAQIQNYRFAGNVRELDNLCHWLSVMVTTQQVTDADLPPTLMPALPTSATTGNDWLAPLRTQIQSHLTQNQDLAYDTLLQTFEQTILHEVLQHTKGNRQEAARLLGWGRNTVTRKLQDNSSHTQ